MLIAVLAAHCRRPGGQIAGLRIMQGQHPKHKGESDPALLGTVERYFIEIMDIPRLQQRIDCFIFARTYGATAERVRSQSI